MFEGLKSIFQKIKSYFKKDKPQEDTTTKTYTQSNSINDPTVTIIKQKLNPTSKPKEKEITTTPKEPEQAGNLEKVTATKNKTPKIEEEPKEELKKVKIPEALPKVKKLKPEISKLTQNTVKKLPEHKNEELKYPIAKEKSELSEKIIEKTIPPKVSNSKNIKSKDIKTEPVKLQPQQNNNWKEQANAAEKIRKAFQGFFYDVATLESENNIDTKNNNFESFKKSFEQKLNQSITKLEDHDQQVIRLISQNLLSKNLELITEDVEKIVMSQVSQIPDKYIN